MRKLDLEIMLQNIGKIFLNIDFNIHMYRENYTKIQCQVYKYEGKSQEINYNCSSSPWKSFICSLQYTRTITSL